MIYAEKTITQILRIIRIFNFILILALPSQVHSLSIHGFEIFRDRFS